ncbi:Solute carrier family 35 member F1, partial [Ananas comosus]
MVALSLSPSTLLSLSPLSLSLPSLCTLSLSLLPLFSLSLSLSREAPAKRGEPAAGRGFAAEATRGGLRLLFVLFLGQLISLFLAASSFTSSLIANLGADAPLAQSFFTYLSLTLVYGSILLYRRQKLRVPWYWYTGLAIVDVQGNFLVVKAYQYSSITSVALLDCWTIPWVIILTWIAMGTRYSLGQFLGAGTCVAGLALVLFSDAGASGEGGKKPLLGDALVIAGTLCYAFSNVGEEFCVKKKDRVEVIAMLGVFGLLVCATEIAIFERKNLQEVKWSPTMISLFAGFAAASFLFYSVFPFLLKMSGATLFNLSLLTSDIEAGIEGAKDDEGEEAAVQYEQLTEENSTTPLFKFISWILVTVMSGATLFNLSLLTSDIEAGIEGAKDDEGEEAAVQYDQLTEENSTTPL